MLTLPFFVIKKKKMELMKLPTSRGCLTSYSIFLGCAVACGILFPQSGIELVPPALGVPSLNHWTAWEVPVTAY